MATRIGFPETRWSLIGRLALRPTEAAVVMDQYADSISRYLRLKLPNEGDLEDVIQEVLLHLFEHPELMAAAEPGAGSRFRYLLMTLAWNEARNRLRERWRRQHREKPVKEDDGAQTVAPETEASETSAMDRAWAESLLAQAWADVRAWASDGTLEAEIPELLEGHLVRGRNLRDLAAELSLPLATCHRRLARGRTWLQKAIVDRLREAGEITEDADQGAACSLLLDILKGPA
ncbi:MAG: sigma-70 family RNA polymerase sigma factor [Planctomycetes bacterium]|nr:sigma-70 family RNA polymerase sigma factor [Planctomycetota bacterium]